MASIDENNILTLLGEQIEPGVSKTINFNLAKLYTTSPVEVPIIVERSSIPGPIVLITSGIHGDEINGVEIVRQLISKKINKPRIGTIICIPVVNIFGFLDMKRAFPRWERFKSSISRKSKRVSGEPICISVCKKDPAGRRFLYGLSYWWCHAL